MRRGGSNSLWSSGKKILQDQTCRNLKEENLSGKEEGKSQALVATQCLLSLTISVPWKPPGYRVKPHGQLVLISFTHYCASTPSLSTSWSRTALQDTFMSGSLILRRVSRLDAFSGYLFRT